MKLHALYEREMFIVKKTITGKFRYCHCYPAAANDIETKLDQRCLLAWGGVLSIP